MEQCMNGALLVKLPTARELTILPSLGWKGREDDDDDDDDEEDDDKNPLKGDKWEDLTGEGGYGEEDGDILPPQSDD